jgi:hypothetical protein
MTTWISSADSFCRELDPSFDESFDLDRFQKITHRREGEWGVRSDASRTRARMRSRGTVAARHKARSFNGVNRRGTNRQLAPNF